MSRLFQNSYMVWIETLLPFQ